MRLNDMFCIVRVAENVPRSGLDQAVALARTHNAHLNIILAGQMAMPIYSPIYASLAAGLIEDLNAKTKVLVDKTAAMANQACAINGVTSTVSSKLDLIGSVAQAAVLQARMADLIVIDQTAGYADTRETILEEMLFRTGRPVLVAAPEPREAIRRIMVAWDGSAHAARAAADALALFPDVTRADVVSVSGEKDISKSVPGADYAHHLARKGIECVVTTLPAGKDTVAAILNAHAVSSGADMIVMGAFGHSRLREFFLGGVTLALTQNATVPLLMAY
jgi:nucleotide-binding universal stress UspA family protein